jgi:short-subunit dehydrogenase
MSSQSTSSPSAAARRVLITGASGGIGYELAKLFAADRWDLVLAARSGDKLSAIAGELSAAHRVHVQTVPIDLCQPGAARQLVDASHSSGHPLTALVNNAGFGVFGPFAESDLMVVDQLIQLNIAVLTDLTRLALPEMVAQRHGYILNVASLAAFQPGPLMAVYYASKAYVLHFSEAIAEELDGTGVRVTALCPGPTETGFVQRAAMKGSKLFERGVMSAQDVAKGGYEGLLHGKRVVIPGFKNKLLSTSVRFAPRILAAKIAKAMQERRSR